MKSYLAVSAVVLASAIAGCTTTVQQQSSRIDAGAPVVETAAGKVQGFVRDEVRTFLGVSYARAERFKAPRAAEAWRGTRSAVKLGDICPQSSPKPESPFLSGPRLKESEDCLNLNVWTPGVGDGKKRAVMVWLHGGGFSTGSSGELDVYDGTRLSASQDVVVVSVNHRLNVMGHLDLSAYGAEYADSANAGVQDLVAALEWVRDNIQQFGGDAGNVTIFGESGGGAKVLTLMSTPKAEGLFQKAIVQSGAVDRMGVTLTPKAASRRVAELTLGGLGVSPKDVAALNGIDYRRLLEVSNRALAQTAEEMQLMHVMQNGIGLAWAPTMDGRYIPQEPVGTRYPAQSKNVPLLIGSNLTEWTTFPFILDLDASARDSKNDWSEAEVDRKLEQRFGPRADAVKDAFRRAYPERRLADAYFVESFLRTPALKTARLKSDQQGAPVYNYVFTWEPRSYGAMPMSYHMAEIAFVFNNVDRNPLYTENSMEAKALAGRMSEAWANFARTGVPSAQGLPVWQPYTRQQGATMILDNSVSLRHHHDERLMRVLAPDYRF